MKFDQRLSTILAVDVIVLVIITVSIVFGLPWLVPLIAGGVALIATLGAQAGYLDARTHTPLIPTATLGISGLMAAAVVGSAGVFALLFAVLPLFSGRSLLRRLPTAIYGTALFVMSDSVLLTPEAVTFGVIIVLTLVLPPEAPSVVANRRDRYAPKLRDAGAETDVNSGASLEPSLQVGSEESGERDMLTPLIEYSGAAAAAIYQPESGTTPALRRTSQVATSVLEFDAEMLGSTVEHIQQSKRALVWYREEQLTTTRLPWLHSNAALSAVALTPIRIDDVFVGALILAFLPPTTAAAGDRAVSSLTSQQAREIQGKATTSGAVVGELLDAQRRTQRYEVERQEYQMITAAAETLSRAQSTEASLKIIARLMRNLTASDAVAIYRFGRESRTLSLQRADSFDGMASVPKHASAESLIAESCRRGHWLPYRDEADLNAHTVFGKRGTRFPDASILVLPLLLEGEPLGAIVLGAQTGEAFDNEVRSRMRLVVSYLTFACASIWRFEDTLEEATRDSLTGLMNRRAFMREAALAHARRERTKNAGALLMLDIDHFKRVNDTWGHQTGDDVIRAFSEEIQTHTRKTDISGRYGGEEFILFLEDTDYDGAQLLAERIRSGMAARVFQSEADEFEVTTSAGIHVIAGDETETLTEAIERADTALYAAKEGGRNRVMTYRDLPEADLS